MRNLSLVQKVSASAFLAGAAALFSQQPLDAIHFAYEECDNDLPYCTNDVCACEAELLCDDPIAAVCGPGSTCVGVVDAGCASESSCSGEFVCS